MSALDGVTETMAVWQPPYYTDADRYPGDPEPGTINWYVAHLEHCLRHYAEILRTRTKTEAPPPPPANAGMAELTALLKKAHLNFRSLIAQLSEEDLSFEYRPGMRLDTFIRNATRHNAWHAGQIALARRMAKKRLNHDSPD